MPDGAAVENERTPCERPPKSGDTVHVPCQRIERHLSCREFKRTRTPMAEQMYRGRVRIGPLDRIGQHPEDIGGTAQPDNIRRPLHRLYQQIRSRKTAV